MVDYDTGYQREDAPDPNERLSRCPGGHGELAVVIVEITDRAGKPYKAVRGCRQCDDGLTFDAGVWLSIMYPADAQGYRRFNPASARAFERFEKKEPERAAQIKAKVLEIVDRRNKERQKKLEAPPGWGG